MEEESGGEDGQVRFRVRGREFRFKTENGKVVMGPGLGCVRDDDAALGFRADQFQRMLFA